MGSRPDGILNRKQAETIKRIAIDSTSIFGQFQLGIWRFFRAWMGV